MIDISQAGFMMIKSDLFPYDTSDESLMLLANQVGRILPDDNGNKIQYLTPKMTGQWIKNSFSYNYGLNKFPYHTDTAFWEKPTKFILMTSKKKSSCETLLIDTKALFDSLQIKELNLFYNSVFTLKTPHETKFVSILQRENWNNILRFDPNIMTPFNLSAKAAVEIINAFIKEAKLITIKWTGENILLVDNWRFLHARSACRHEPERILKRIYIIN